MTIKDFVSEFHKYDISPDGPPVYEEYNKALDLISEGELSEARLALRRALRKDPSFDDGNMLLGLVLFSLGNRIDGMKQINDIVSPEKHKTAVGYIEKLSGGTRANREEEKAVKTEKTGIELDFKDEITVEKPKKKNIRQHENEEFSKRFKKAKKAQEDEMRAIPKREAEKSENQHSAPSLQTVIAKKSAEKPTFLQKNEDKPQITVPEEIPETQEAEKEPEIPEEPVELILDFDFMMKSEDTELNVIEKMQPAEINSVETDFAEKESEPDQKGEVPVTNVNNKIKAAITVGVSVAILALFAYLSFKLGL